MPEPEAVLGRGRVAGAAGGGTLTATVLKYPGPGAWWTKTTSPRPGVRRWSLVFQSGRRTARLVVFLVFHLELILHQVTRILYCYPVTFGQACWWKFEIRNIWPGLMAVVPVMGW